MNVLDGFKTLYTAGGGQENLDELQGNKDQNMHSVIYGDGLDTTLPSNIENDVLSIAKGGGGLPEVTSEDNGDVLTVVNGEWAKAAPGGLIKGTLYAVEPATTDPDLTEDFTKPENEAGAGLSQTEGGTPLTYAEIVEFMDTHDALELVANGYTEYITMWKKTDGVIIDGGGAHLVATYASFDGSSFGCDFSNGSIS